MTLHKTLLSRGRLDSDGMSDRDRRDRVQPTGTVTGPELGRRLGPDWPRGLLRDRALRETQGLVRQGVLGLSTRKVSVTRMHARRPARAALAVLVTD